jgi:hypothetical protein
MLAVRCKVYPVSASDMGVVVPTAMSSMMLKRQQRFRVRNPSDDAIWQYHVLGMPPPPVSQMSDSQPLPLPPPSPPPPLPPSPPPSLVWEAADADLFHDAAEFQC